MRTKAKGAEKGILQDPRRWWAGSPASPHAEPPARSPTRPPAGSLKGVLQRIGFFARSRLPRETSIYAVFVALVTLPNAAMAHGPPSLPDLIDKLTLSVVNISTSQFADQQNGSMQDLLEDGSPLEEFLGGFLNNFPSDDNGAVQQSRSLGSGFVIDGTKGLIVTNHHVIEDADEIVVIFDDGTKLLAQIVGTDPQTDIAVLEVQSDKLLPEVTFGDSRKMRVGDWVMAIGNPFGQAGTVTTGIVSARNRNIYAGSYDNFLQTDAAISQGNSGGPLFNAKGEVVGINTAIISPSGGSIGLGFAIPSQIAIRVVDQIGQFGETRRGWLGVRIQQVNARLAEGLEMSGPRGALVTSVVEGAPADLGGVQRGDVILTFDDEPLETIRKLPRLVAEADVGSLVKVDIWRDGQKIIRYVTLGRLEDAALDLEPHKTEKEPAEPAHSMTLLSLDLSQLTKGFRDKFEVADGIEGVGVVNVEAGSAAEKQGIVAGQIIIEVGREAVNSPAQIAEKIENLKKSGRRVALLFVANPEGETRFVALSFQ